MDEDQVELPVLTTVCADPGSPTPGEQLVCQAECSRTSERSGKAKEVLRQCEQKRSEATGALLLECSSELQEKTEERGPLVRVSTDLRELRELLRTAVETSHHTTSAHETREDLEKELRSTRMMRDETVCYFRSTRRRLRFFTKGFSYR